MNHNSTQNKLIHTIHAAAGAIALIAFASTASAQITIDTSYVGDVGNANDSTGYGGVDYGYYIGTYEVTNNQYVSFLNEVGASNANNLYNPNMGSDTHGGIQQSGTSGNFTYSARAGMGEKAVNYVNFWDAARFTNWLTTGDTESGVYNLGGETFPTNNTITRDATAWANGGVAVASENEWYKAAYYQPVGDGGDTDSYWLYPTASNSITTADANYAGSVGTLTDVGTYSDAASYYGTYDQGGNLWETNDTIVGNDDRGLRGGPYQAGSFTMRASSRDDFSANGEDRTIGFRITTLDANAVPEPSTYTAMLGVIALAFASIRRKGRSASSNL